MQPSGAAPALAIGTPATRGVGRWRRLMAPAFFALFALMMFSDGIAAQTRSFHTFPDAVDQAYPSYQKLAKSVHAGYLPLWNADAFSGYAFPGEMQPGVFYPPNLLLVALFGSGQGIATRALDYFIIAHFALGALGAFAMARAFGIGQAAALGAGLVFAFFGATAYRASAQSSIFYGLCLAPWAAYWCLRYWQRPRWHFAVLAGATAGLQILAGHAQPAFHTVLFCAATPLLSAARHRMSAGERWWRVARLGAIAATACAAIALPQLLTSATYLSDAYRWIGSSEPIGPGQPVPLATFLTRHIVRPGDVLTLLDPWRVPADDGNSLFIGGAALLMLLAFAMTPALRAHTAGPRRRLLALAAIALLATAAALGQFTPIARVLHAIPLVSQIRELGRYAILIHLALAVFVGLAIQAFHRVQLADTPLKRRSVVGAALAAAVALQWAARGADALSQPAADQLMLGVAAVVALVITPAPRWRAAIAVTAVALSALMARELYTGPVAAGQSAEQLHAPSPVLDFLAGQRGRGRVIVDASARLPRNIATVRGFEAKLGFGATMYRPYFDLINRDWALDGKANDVLNMRYVLSRDPQPLSLVMEDTQRGLRLYERPTWYPRAFFQSQIGLAGRDIEASGRIALESYADMHQRYRVWAEAPERLIFSENAYPGWVAYVDGRRADVGESRVGNIPASLRSIEVPAGDHIVILTFEPFGMNAALAVWAVALIASLAVFVSTTRGLRPPPTRPPVAALARGGSALPAACVAIALVAFLGFGLAHLRAPGPHYDELLFVNAALGGPNSLFVHSRILGVPVMLMSYIGALKAYQFAPIFAAFGVSIESVRIPAVLMGAAGIVTAVLLVWRITRKAWLAALAAALMATDASYTHLIRTDFGPVANMVVIKLLAAIALFSFVETGKLRYAWALVALFGLGIYDKLNFIWIVLAYVGGAALVFSRPLLAILRQRRWLAIAPVTALGAVVAGATASAILPLLVTTNASSDLLAQLQRAIRLYRSTVGGDAPRQLMLSEPVSELLTDLLQTSTRLAAPALLGLGLVSLAVIALAVRAERRSGAASPARVVTPWRALAFLGVAFAAIFAQIVVTREAGGPHHIMALWPLHHIIAVVCVGELARLAGGAGRIWAVRAGKSLALLFASALVVVAMLQSAISIGYAQAFSTARRFNPLWTEAAFGLADYIERHPEYELVYAADWGIGTQVLTLAPNARTKLQDVWPVFNGLDAAGTWAETSRYLFGGKRALVVSRTGGAVVFARARANWLRLMRDHQPGATLVEVIPDGDGRPVFEIYAVAP